MQHEIDFGGLVGTRDVSLNDYYLQQVSYDSNISNVFVDGYLQDTWYPTEHWKIEIRGSF